MKASMLCGAHYEGAEAHLQPPPVSPSQCDPSIAQQSYDHYLSYAALADELGYDWISVSEHHYSPLILAPSVAPLAGALTQVVRRARIALLGPLASINNPVRIAEEVAMLDQLSHGRIEILPLRGTPIEFNSYQPLETAQTQPITQEATQLIRKALTETQPFAWDGEYFQFPKVAVWPRVLQKPFPPMYFSGNSVGSALFAAREHLGLCISFHMPETVAEHVRQYREEAARAGWQPHEDQIVYRGFVIVADTDERAHQLEERFLVPHQRSLLRGPRPPGHVDTDEARSGRMLFCGSPDTVVQRLRAFHDTTGVGVVDLIFSGGQTDPADVRRSIELFGREVLPRIREFAREEVLA
jgi:alkanesulfonate monooxygenase SsuD/methylene tetrahydromethanopterin reductase-like flavin-dependent oxidoreductase (luciferase family)